MAWFKARATQHAITSPEGAQTHAFGVAIAKTLYQLGEREEGLQLLAEVESYGKAGHEWLATSILIAELEIGLRDQAWQRAAVLLENEQSVSPVLHRLLPAPDGEWNEGWSTMRTEWWSILREQQPTEDRAVTLRKLEELLRPSGDSAVAAMAVKSSLGLESLKPPQSSGGSFALRAREERGTHGSSEVLPGRVTLAGNRRTLARLRGTESCPANTSQRRRRYRAKSYATHHILLPPSIPSRSSL